LVIHVKNFCDLADISAEKIEMLLSKARDLEQHGSTNELQGKVLALLFLNPSLRTLTSLQATMVRLGGGTFVVSPEMSIHGLETRSGIVMDGTAAEHIREAVPVIASYADAIGVRAIAQQNDLDEDLSDGYFEEIRSLCDVPVINLESSIRHPCQSLADWKTLNDHSVPKQGGKLVFSWVYHPEALPLAIMGDTIHMAVSRGMDVTVLRPDGFDVPEQLRQRAELAGSVSGGSLTETDDRNKALEGAHVVYAGSWSSTRFYGDNINEQKIRREHGNWCMDESWFDGKPSKSCYFMHALPVRRGVEVEDQVLDGPRSIVIPQARNRMFAQMSVLTNLLS
jgi:N-acetylornithine carbamoyltransferase